MLNAGHGLAAYRAAADKNEAFRVLADSFVQKKQAKELSALLTEHEKNAAQNLWIVFYRGELHFLRGEFEQAERDFTAAVAKARPRDDVWRLRNALLRAKVKSGKAVAYYLENGDRDTFRDLCFACVTDKNAAQLEALVAARGMKAADDRSLLSWELEGLWLKKDYQGAVKFIEQHRGGAFASKRYRGQSDGYYVRALVKVGRSGDAVKEAESLSKNKRISPVLLILAHAATGNAKQAIEAVERFPDDRYLVEDCYRDTDLGPNLRTEPFEAFRARFPEPKREN